MKDLLTGLRFGSDCDEQPDLSRGVKMKAHEAVLGLSCSRLTGAERSDSDAGRQPGRPQVLYHL